MAAKANGPGSTPTPVLAFTPGLAGTWHLRLGDGADSRTDTYTVRIDPKAPNLQARSPSPGGSLAALAGGFYSVTASVKNAGFLDSGAYQVSFVASTDTVLDAGDQTLLTETRPSLAPGARDDLALDLPIPATLAPGTWQLLVVADPANQVVETDETDNVSPPLALQVQAPLCAPDGYEEDDTLADANPVTLGTPQTHNQCDDGMDWVRFDATAGAGYLVQMNFSTVAVSDRASAYDASGTLIAGPAVARAPGFWFQATATGPCELELGQSRWGSTYGSDSGAYTLQVDRCDADAYEPDDIVADAAPIAVGDTQQHNACDAAHPDWQVFDATAGTTYTVSTGVVGPAIDTVVTLENATGAVLATNDDAKHNSRYSLATWTATYTGKVYVKVDAKAGGGINSDYTVTLQ